MNPKTIQEAIRTIWVLPASGLAADRVYFAQPDAPSPAPSPRVVISLGDIDHVGAADEVMREYDALAPLGQEIVHTVSGLREMTLTIEAFSSKADGTEQANDARALASRVSAFAGLPTVRPPLNAAGVGILRRERIRWVPGVVRAGFEGRAILEVVLCVSETAEARVGYIQTVKGTRTIKDKSTDVGAPYTIVIED